MSIRNFICSQENLRLVFKKNQEPYSNLSMGIFEGCFIFDFASLPLEVAKSI